MNSPIKQKEKRFRQVSYEQNLYDQRSSESMSFDHAGDMLLLEGDLKSGHFSKPNRNQFRGVNKNDTKTPSRFLNADPDLFIRNAAQGMLDSMFVVNDEQRRKPFTVPVVQVEINTDPYWTTENKYT